MLPVCYVLVHYLLFFLLVPYRLVDNDGQESTRGRLEVFYRGQWGTVCSEGIGNEAAMVVCRAMSLPGGAVVTDADTDTAVDRLVLLDEVVCDGGEASLLDCRHGSIGRNSCERGNIVVMECEDINSGTVKPEEMEVKY